MAFHVHKSRIDRQLHTISIVDRTLADKTKLTWSASVGAVQFSSNICAADDDAVKNERRVIQMI